MVTFERQERWRAAWFADLSHDGSVNHYYVRGHRGGNFRAMITLQQEADVNRVLRKHGVPVPKVHGMIDDPPAIVMDRRPVRWRSSPEVGLRQRDDNGLLVAERAFAGPAGAVVGEFGHP